MRLGKSQFIAVDIQNNGPRTGITSNMTVGLPLGEPVLALASAGEFF